MPNIYWSFPCLDAKPTSQVLLERGDQFAEYGNQPLIVTGHYGAGNVLYMGLNGTWRWRRVGTQAQYFDRFWIQVVHFLVETKSLQGSRRGIIEANRKAYEIGDRVTLTARALSATFEPLDAPVLAAKIQSENGQERGLDLQPLPGQPGEYEASFFAQWIGRSQVTLVLPDGDGADGIEPTNFRVRPPGVESRSHWLNEKLLRELATASGGTYGTLGDLEQIIDAIPQNESTTVHSSPPEPLWNLSARLRYLAFLLPFVLLVVEWTIRKRYQLL